MLTWRLYRSPSLAAAIATISPFRSSREAIDIELHDTFFVVAHFHPSILLGASVLVATLVAYRYGALNWAIQASWFLLLIHLVLAVLPWLPPDVGDHPESGVVVRLRPLGYGLAHTYGVSAIFGFSTIVVGLGISLWRSLRATAPA